jgi:hypothetical protein
VFSKDKAILPDQVRRIMAGWSVADARILRRWYVLYHRWAISSIPALDHLLTKADFFKNDWQILMGRVVLDLMYQFF